MQTYSAVLFDLDGTLIDSASTVIGALRDTLAYYEKTPREATLNECLGPPMRATLMQYLPPEQVEEALARYRADYEENHMLQCSLYPGVAQMLRALGKTGYRLCVATSKPLAYARKILQHHGVDGLFDVIAGADMGTGLDTKEGVVKSALAQPCLRGTSPVMIGDRRYDMEGAAACGLPAIGVLYGYGSREELAAYAPRALIDSVPELCSYLRENYQQ